MRHYCSGCWTETPVEAECCPACGHSLKENRDRYLDKLIAALRHVEPTRAALAIQILSEMRPEPSAVMPLIDLLNTANDAYVLRSAAVALGHFADPRAADALKQRTQDLSTPLVVRTAAVDALARIAGADSRSAIEGALSDPNAVVREHARLALGCRPVSDCS